VPPKKELACSIRRNAQENRIRCLEYEGMGHQCRDCPNRRLEKEKAVHMVNSQKAQQKEWRKSSENTLQQRTFKHCEEGVPEEADLFKLGWSNGEVIVLYLTYKDYGKKEHYIAKVSQTSFSHISIDSSIILTVLKAPESS